MLKKILTQQLEERVHKAGVRVHHAFAKKALGRNYSRDYSSLDRQGDLNPLISGRTDRDGYLSVPDAMDADLSNIRIAWENNRRVLSVYFGHRSNLVKMSPQIMWYEYGFSGQQSLVSETQGLASGFFRSRGSRRSTAWYWVDRTYLEKFFTIKPFKTFGRYGEGFLFPVGHGVLDIVESRGGSAIAVKSIPRVGMFGKTLISLKSDIAKIISG